MKTLQERETQFGNSKYSYFHHSLVVFGYVGFSIIYYIRINPWILLAMYHIKVICFLLHECFDVHQNICLPSLPQAMAAEALLRTLCILGEKS